MESFRVFPFQRKNGFTLVEAIVVISILLILGGILTPIVSNQLLNKRIEVTEEKLKNIKKAIIGDPEVVQFGQRTDFGYFGDMGSFPNSLVDLIVIGTQPAWQYYTNYGGYTDINIGAGWRGPYLDPTQDPPGSGNYLYLKDGWNRNFMVIVTGFPAGTQIARRIYSYGPNGVSESSGTECGGDDICIDIFWDEVRGYVQGNTWNECGVGIQYYEIRIFYPTGGALTSYAVAPDAGKYWFSTFNVPIPIGIRRIFADTDTATPNPNYDLKQFLVISNGPDISINLRRNATCTSPSP
ncbi:MAG: type II secretion system protein [Candidatus Aminicenantia bacterium]